MGKRQRKHEKGNPYAKEAKMSDNEVESENEEDVHEPSRVMTLKQLDRANVRHVAKEEAKLAMEYKQEREAEISSDPYKLLVGSISEKGSLIVRNAKRQRLEEQKAREKEKREKEELRKMKELEVTKRMELIKRREEEEQNRQQRKLGLKAVKSQSKNISLPEIGEINAIVEEKLEKERKLFELAIDGGIEGESDKAEKEEDFSNPLRKSTKKGKKGGKGGKGETQSEDENSIDSDAEVAEADLVNGEKDEDDEDDEFVKWQKQVPPPITFDDGAKKEVINLKYEGLGVASSEAELPSELPSLSEYHVKPSLAERWTELFHKWHPEGSKKEIPFTPLQEHLFPLLNSYRDVLYSCRPETSRKEVSQAYALHIMNHLLKSKYSLLRNNAKINAAREERKIIDTPQDQGFTRPKVLLLTPFKNTAFDVVTSLLSLAPKANRENIIRKNKFLLEYTDLENELKYDPLKPRPQEFFDIFRDNIDDCFRFGFAIGCKSIRLYSDFYRSDVVVASPLGLKLLIGEEGDKHREQDFLSSIELVIVDQADVIFMQNWEHIKQVFASLNLIPLNPHETDFSRVRPWFLDGSAKLFRQNVIISSIPIPELNALFTKKCQNIRPKIKISADLSQNPGTISLVARKIRQVFHRVPCSSFAEQADAKFIYFKEQILPKLVESTQTRILVVIPSYFDFVRVRNLFQEQELSFAQINDHSPAPDVARARTLFFQGRAQFLLYTERFHFYNRHVISGAAGVVFYGLPLFSHYYPEILSFPPSNPFTASGEVIAETAFTAFSLFTVFDKLALERIVGQKKASVLLSSDKSVHMFY
eukprot:TRINITY_DN1289_c1_g4_i1.p1 TRINITY_DN1289_c1_g4~~TRINITY_DN1289_c1_g4_i1.p1  ORF type:complete len:818 (-),score=259.10 TRINITY_DN1289_c1_g4_i1:25-2478(-)